MKISPSETAAPDDALDYWRIFQTFPDPCVIFKTDDPVYTIVDINEARERMLGDTREALVGKSLFSVRPYTVERFTETVAKNLHRHLQRVVRTGRSYQLDPISSAIPGVNGLPRTVYVQAAYIPVRDASDKVSHIIGLTREVTDEVHAMERARITESRLKAALTIGKVGSWTYDAVTGRIAIDTNMYKMFRFTDAHADRYTLQAFLKSIHDDDRPRVTAAVNRSLERHTPFEEECRVWLADGSQRWILARGEPEGDQAGSAFSGVVIDLTEQRDLRAQIELARQQDRLNRQITKMLQQRNEELEVLSRSKDEFVALASHQLRTPATAVKQYIGMVLQGYVGSVTDVQQDVLQKAFESNERQLEIINQILNAARADTGNLVMTLMPLDLKSLVHGLAADMRPGIEQRKHTFTVRLPEQPVYINADLGYLRMAIENILHNASIYTPVGGHVTLSLSVKDNAAKLAVQDTGVGIKKADIGQLFVKFARIHNPLSVEAGGSGIGLYLAGEIVHLHGGNIDVRSRVGRGTTFTMTLPTVQSATKNA